MRNPTALAVPADNDRLPVHHVVPRLLRHRPRAATARGRTRGPRHRHPRCDCRSHQLTGPSPSLGHASWSPRPPGSRALPS